MRHFPHMPEWKVIWPVNLTGHCPKIILSAVLERFDHIINRIFLVLLGFYVDTVFLCSLTFQ